MDNIYVCSICLGVPIVPTKILIFNDGCREIPSKRVCLRCARNFLQMNLKKEERIGIVRCPFCNDPRTNRHLSNVSYSRKTYEVDTEMMTSLTSLSKCGVINPFTCDCGNYTTKSQEDLRKHIKEVCPLSTRFCDICKEPYKFGDEYQHLLQHTNIVDEPSNYDSDFSTHSHSDCECCN